jgi:hypothetical protein
MSEIARTGRSRSVLPPTKTDRIAAKFSLDLQAAPPPSPKAYAAARLFFAFG